VKNTDVTDAERIAHWIIVFSLEEALEGKRQISERLRLLEFEIEETASGPSVN
jgi:hypothetical protein